MSTLKKDNGSGNFYLIICLIAIISYFIGAPRVISQNEVKGVVSSINLVSEAHSAYQLDAEDGETYIIKATNWPISFYGKGNSFSITTNEKVSYTDRILGNESISLIVNICLEEECHDVYQGQEAIVSLKTTPLTKVELNKTTQTSYVFSEQGAYSIENYRRKELESKDISKMILQEFQQAAGNTFKMLCLEAKCFYVLK